MSFSSLSKAVSGLMANQLALNTTAHNLSNVNTPGYVRQQVLMKDGSYRNIGNSGTSPMSVGMGTDVQSIRQVRDIFLDKAYRQENSRLGFYDSQSNAIDEVETILGELEGKSFSDILNNFWKSINELKKFPDRLETRGSFVKSAGVFVDRANLVMEQLTSYQENLNTKIETTVNRINTIGDQIHNLNSLIVKNELNGAHANDYRDQRNALLDELSGMVDVSYSEDKNGSVQVKIEGTSFVTQSGVEKIGLRAAAPFSTFTEPYWEDLDAPLFNLNTTIDGEHDNDKGTLKGMLLARGTRKASYLDMKDEDTYAKVKPSAIMRAQAQFDNLIHRVVTLVNDELAPRVGDKPYGLNGSQGIELFKRKTMDRYDSDEDPNNEYTLYSAGNLEINPDVLADYNKICLSKQNGVNGDNTIVTKIINEWDKPFASIEPGSEAKYKVRDYYNSFTSDIGNMGKMSDNQRDNQIRMAVQIDNQRNSLMGVSSDEELSNMMKYQHAYNASARVITVVDEMIKQIVTSLGLVGR
jgi:flagellar hook-associated protein 1 FlgK